MTLQPILVFDFDGVIVDGLLEYWDSSRKACLNLLKKNYYANSLPLDMPSWFRELRPWVKHGWEMVLLAAESVRKDSYLATKGTKFFSDEYKKNCTLALRIWGWDPKQLQIELDYVRKQAINNEKEKWLSLHRPFSGVPERIQRLTDEEIQFAILTTKGNQFTLELLNHLNLHPTLLYGHESGNKLDLLLHLSKKHHIKGFIEDRRKTLEAVINAPPLKSIPCYLADWGYLKPEDTKQLPTGINLLSSKLFMCSLANWP